MSAILDGDREMIADGLSYAEAVKEWSRIPAGWDAITRICEQVGQRLPVLAEQIAQKIQEELPAYQQAGVPLAEHYKDIHQHAQILLRCIQTHSDPVEQDLVYLRAVGRRRALQGLPVHALMQAYHIGCREIWEELVREGNRHGPDSAASLIHAVPRVWGWFHYVSSVVAGAHQQTIHMVEAETMQLRHRFLGLLLTGDTGSEELLELAQSLGFDPNADFLAAAVGTENHNAIVRRLQSHLEARCGTVHSVPAGEAVIVLAQNTHEHILVSVIRDLLPHVPVGIGLVRPGLGGARLSVGDAEQALGVARRRGGICRFADEWLLCTLIKANDRVDPLVAPAREVGRRYPHLAETVRTFAENGFNAAKTARRLSTHPNTVAYRLRRWQQLTGLNPYSVSGLAASLVGLEVAK